MRFTKLLVILLATLTIFGCRKDIDGVTTVLEQQPNVPILEDSGFSGLIVDEDGQPIQDAIVDFVTFSTNTDENGRFSYSGQEDLSLNQDGSLVTITKEGYFKGFKFIFPEEGNQTAIKVIMVRKTSAGNFNSAAGGTIEIEGASLQFSPNSIKNDQTNDDYNGSVEVYFHHFNIDDHTAGASMPGDLRGVDAENNIRALASYGMAAVELYGTSGEKLNLKDNTTATLNIQAPELNNLPETMPMWYLNEVTGFWVEDGTCVLNNGMYTSEVSHFSFWNCDAPFPLINLSGTLTDSNGLPIVNAYIKISILDSGLAGFGYTNEFGQFTGKVPKDEELVLSVVSDCGLIIDQSAIGSFNTDTNLPTIEVDNGTSEIILIGEVLCNGAPLSTGYVKINYGENDYLLVELSENGAFAQVRHICNNSFGEYTAIAYNTVDNTSSEEFTFQIEDQGIIDLGILDACTTQIDEFIRYSIDGQDQGYIYSVQATYGDRGLVLRTRDSTNIFLHFNLFDPKLGDQHPFLTSYEDEFGNFSDCYIYEEASSCESMVVNIEEITRIEGEYIKGSFEGTLFNFNFPASAVLSGEFEIKLESYTPNAVVKGRTWDDTNGNGIQDPDETGINGTVLRLDQGIANGRLIHSYGDGEFVTHVLADVATTIKVNNNSYTPTLQDAGSEDIDSDLDQQGNTETFTLGDEEYLLDIGAGFRTPTLLNCEVFPGSDFVFCPGQEVDMTVEVLDGVPPFSYTWNNGSTTQLISNGGDQGLFIVTVTDAAGNSCVNEIALFNDIIEISEAIVTAASCNANDGSITFPDATDEMSIEWEGLGSQEFTLTDLAPGTYVYQITNADGCSTPWTSVVVPGSSGIIGNQVWVDNDSGIPNTFDAGDYGLEGAEIYLWDVELNQIIEEQITDQNGDYLFNVSAGIYQIEVIIPEGFAFLDLADDFDDPTGSKIDPVTGKTQEFALECGEVNLKVDIGVKPN